MESHLGYAKHDVTANATPNSRNGKSKKSVVSEYGEQEISVPREPLGRVRTARGEEAPVQRNRH